MGDLWEAPHRWRISISGEPENTIKQEIENENYQDGADSGQYKYQRIRIETSLRYADEEKRGQRKEVDIAVQHALVAVFQ